MVWIVNDDTSEWIDDTNLYIKLNIVKYLMIDLTIGNKLTNSKMMFTIQFYVPL